MKNKLNIAIFHFTFVYSGGGEKLVLEEAAGFEKLGHKVTVFAPVVDRRRCFPDLIKKVDVRTFLPHLPSFVPEWESFQIFLTCVLAPFFSFRFRKFDIILAANQPSPWIAFWVKLLFGVPYVSYLAQPTRFLYPRKIDREDGLIFVVKRPLSITSLLLMLVKPLAYLLDKVSIGYSNEILANGEYMKGVLEKVYSLKVVSCPAGAYPEKRIVNYESRMKGKLLIGKYIRKPYILITNRHFPQKRFEYAITSLPSALQVNPDVSLIITGGETSYTGKLKKLTKELSLEDRVFFLGLVKEQDLRRLYSNAAIYVYTAPQEDFGMGIIEAMAAGTPVVAWDRAGPSKIILNEKNGLLAKPLQVVDFAKKISLILSDKKLGSSLGLAGWLAAKEKYSYQRHCRLLEEAFFLNVEK